MTAGGQESPEGLLDRLGELPAHFEAILLPAVADPVSLTPEAGGGHPISSAQSFGISPRMRTRWTRVASKTTSR